MARDSLYYNAIFPSSAMLTTEAETCCNEATGAAAAATAQQYRSDVSSDFRAGGAGGLGVVSDRPTGFQTAAGVPVTGARRGSCKCWIVALAAVVLIAVVAKS